MTAASIYYLCISIVSFALTLIYIFRWHKHFDVHMTVVFILIPIANISYLLMFSGAGEEAMLTALKMIYLGGCFLPWVTAMCVAELCGIKVRRPVRLASFIASSAVFAAVMTIGHSDIFYKSYSFGVADHVFVIQKEYGFMHTVHYVVIISYLIADLAMIAYSYLKKKQVSRRILLLLFFPIPVTMAGYAMNSLIADRGIEIVPVTYVFAQIIYLFIAHRMAVYDVGDMVVEALVESGDTAFITTDFKMRYLGSNETAKKIIPDLSLLSVDGPVGKTEALKDTVINWIDVFEKEGNTDTVYYRTGEGEGEKIYSVTADYLTDGRKRRGYQVFLEDDTQNQKYIKLIDKYNSDLQKDVAAKTERIVEMHDRLILGMATMVESRDNSTGGHIRRTSEGVRILIDEMKKDASLGLTDEFCKNIIKAAPMHDLGKIAVDDAVLRKAGAFTPEEREKMKQHSAEGARIVHEILKDTDDAEFRRIAENVAHYHHERVDGKGYPDGLSGDEIPFEARIMAIADVYDALVSRRVYKEKFSFEKADAIILEGMGTQFDASLRKYYEAARPNLEEYYSKEQ